MKKIIKKMKTELENCGKFPIFEIEVINKNEEEDWIIFDIFIHKNSLIAQHESTTKKEETSKKIAFVKMEIDTFFSLDENLQELYSICIDKIINSDFFKLREE